MLGLYPSSTDDRLPASLPTSQTTDIDIMEYRRLGKAGLQVSEFSFGAWVTFGKQVGEDAAASIMGYAYDNGINFFDNAEGYEQGNAEIVMGEALKALKLEPRQLRGLVQGVLGRLEADAEGP